MDTNIPILLSYLSALVKTQAQKLIASQTNFLRLKALTVPVEPDSNVCPSCEFYSRRILILEEVIAFLIRVIRRAIIRYTLDEKIWICTFLDRNAMPIKGVKSLFGISRTSYYRWKIQWLGWGNSSFIHLAKMLPDKITFWIYAIKAANPRWGKLKISQMMALIGLHISSSSVWRYLRRIRPMPKKPSFKLPDPNSHKLKPRYPNHYWAADTTTISFFGFFKVRILAILDLYSRKVLCLQALAYLNASEVRELFVKTFSKFGKPQHLITDNGSEFKHLNLSIDHRFGRVRCPASTARVERFFKSLKYEALKYLFCPTARSCQKYLNEYITFYNRYRAHQALEGKTPEQVYDEIPFKPPNRFNFEPLPKAKAKKLVFFGGLVTVFTRAA